MMRMGCVIIAKNRTGKSCTSQLLNLTEHIEDGYDNRQITGAVFVNDHWQNVAKQNYCKTGIITSDDFSCCFELRTFSVSPNILNGFRR